MSKDSDPLLRKVSDSYKADVIEEIDATVCCIPAHWIDSYQYNAWEKRNGLLGTIGLLLNAMIGSGILMQAYVFMESGILNTMLEYCLVGGMTYGGVYLLFRCGENAKTYDFSSLLFLSYGRTGEIFFDLTVVLGNFGVLLSYVLLVGTMSVDVFFDAFNINDASVPEQNTVKIVTTFASFGVILPLCLIRNFGRLVWISYFSITAIGMTVIFIIVNAFFTVVSGLAPSDATTLSSLSGSSATIGSVVFAFGYSTAVFHTFAAASSTLQAPKTFVRVLQTTTICGVLLCFTIGLLGYVSFGSRIKSNILENFNGIFGIILKIPFIVHLILIIPGDILILRYSVFRLLGTDIENVSSLSYVAITFLILGVVLTTSCALQIFLSNNDSLSLVLDVTGGISGSLLNFILPAMIASRLTELTFATKVAIACLFAFGSVVTAVVILNLLKPFL
jgi:sodium-coupled neutral amino acid transporter 1